MCEFLGSVLKSKACGRPEPNRASNAKAFIINRLGWAVQGHPPFGTSLPLMVNKLNSRWVSGENFTSASSFATKGYGDQ